MTKKIKLRVLNDRVLIKPDPVEVQGASTEVKSALESGKLVLPDAYEAFYKNLPDSGVIVGLGKDANQFSLGQRVHFAKMAAAKVDVGEKLLIVREYDIDFIYETEY